MAVNKLLKQENVKQIVYCLRRYFLLKDLFKGHEWSLWPLLIVRRIEYEYWPNP